MSQTVCIGADSLDYPEGGGHQWVFLNWALSFKSCGCDVIWLEQGSSDVSESDLRLRVSALKERLEPFGLADRVAVCLVNDDQAVDSGVEGCLSLEEASQADLFFNLNYQMHPRVVERFGRSALLDIDPGLLQRWVKRGELSVARHDLYFTIGETVARESASFPIAEKTWLYTPPCVDLDSWPVQTGSGPAPFTTITHWYMHQWVQEDDGNVLENNKRVAFIPYLDLPRHVSQPLELALCMGIGDEVEDEMLRAHGWRTRHAHDVSATPREYRQYIQRSQGEFSCAKPAYVRLQTAWVSDRTLCYLASGKPVVVEHTGPSSFLPDAAGMYRFRNFDEAVRSLNTIALDYGRAAREARSLAEEYFAGHKVARGVLERALQ